MKKMFTPFAALSACLALCAANAAPVDLDGMAPASDEGFGRWYCGVSPGLLVFGRGVSANPAAYGAARFGYEHGRVLAFEFGGLAAPSVNPGKHGRRQWGGTGQLYGLHADALAHWDMYSRWFDPYLIGGAGVYGGSKPFFGNGRAAFAPRIGVGAMSHLARRVSLRADAVALRPACRGSNFAGSFEFALVWHFGE